MIAKSMRIRIGWDSNGALTLGNARVPERAILEIMSRIMGGAKAIVGAPILALLIIITTIMRLCGIMEVQEIGMVMIIKQVNL